MKRSLFCIYYYTSNNLQNLTSVKNTFSTQSSLSFCIFILIVIAFIITLEKILIIATILLVLWNHVLDIHHCFFYLHLVHPLCSIPMKKCFSPKHWLHLLINPSENLCHWGRVCYYCCRRSFWITPHRHLTAACHNVMWYPFYKLSWIFI